MGAGPKTNLFDLGHPGHYMQVGITFSFKLKEKKIPIQFPLKRVIHGNMSIRH